MMVLVGKVVTETYEDRADPPAAGVLPSRQTYAMDFTETDHIVIAGEIHGLGTADLCVGLYQRVGTTLHAITGGIQIAEATYDVAITLLQPLNGRVVLLG